MSKRCRKCGEEKPLEDFHRRNTQGVKDGRASYCKACEKARKAAFYVENRERIIERTGAYQRANWEAALAAGRRWNARNPDKIRAANQANAAKIAANARRWDKENPERQLARQARRRARKLAAFVEDVVLDDLLENGNLCGICGDPIEEPPHIDHIIPLARGGMHEIANCQLAHPTCNYRKSDLLDYSPEALAA